MAGTMGRRLHGKVALVTGASRGIGKATAEALAAEGAEVVLAARSEAALAALAGALQEAGGRAHVAPVDLADEASILNLAGVVKDRCGRLDILINNAGVAHPALLEQTATSDWDRCMAVNARGAFILCRETIELLRQAEPGYIVNISSVVGVKGYANQIAYSASKHALRGMSIALAEELRGDNIRVHVICPGGVGTELVHAMRPDINRAELIAPEEIAELVVYLVTRTGNGVVDEIRIRRETSGPWF